MTHYTKQQLDAVRLFCDLHLAQITDKKEPGVAVSVFTPGMAVAQEKFWPTPSWGPTVSQQADITAWIARRLDDAMTMWFPPREVVGGKAHSLSTPPDDWGTG